MLKAQRCRAEHVDDDCMKATLLKLQKQHCRSMIVMAICAACVLWLVVSNILPHPRIRNDCSCHVVSSPNSYVLMRCHTSLDLARISTLTLT
mmetsp:Transcript_26055/g.38191  ORF Transcript_26055/g.38191 Transcript_26055/m.38191 type:complete len:92 (+) Transcript_26055:866-1141(+)